jgi:hypothetical protein
VKRAIPETPLLCARSRISHVTHVTCHSIHAGVGEIEAWLKRAAGACPRVRVHNEVGRSAKLIFQARNHSMLGIIEGFAHVRSYEI